MLELIEKEIGITIDENEWDQVIQTNINGLFYCCKAVIPFMKDKKDGLIINVSSWSGNHVGLYQVCHILLRKRTQCNDRNY